MAKVRIAGIEAEVVSDAKAETADYVVCVPWDGPAYFPDDCLAACSVCGRAIRHRPYVPKTPPKVCIFCLEATLNARRH